MTIYTVKPGDTLSAIAERSGVPAARIAEDNGLDDPDALAVGQALLLLEANRSVTVEEGDTLASLAEELGVSPLTLLRNNPQLIGLPGLKAGERLTVTLAPPPVRPMRINGYAYSFVRPEVLRAALPYLTMLSSFPYGFAEDGTLLPPPDGEMLKTASGFPTSTVLVLTTLTEAGTFSGERASTLFASSEAQQTLIRSLLSETEEKGFSAVDVDFEYVLPADRERYAAFVSLLRASLSPRGVETIVSLAPKTSDGQTGLLYEAHDYALLGQAADRVLLMTYEWGYTYGPPRAVSPLDQVRRVIEYALTRIEPSEKILIGLPNYGYDWTLPYVRGESKAESLSCPEAVKRAVTYGAVIEYDPASEAPYFRYTLDGKTHEVWFGDARSFLAHASLVTAYGLYGVSVWNVMRPSPQLFGTLNGAFRLPMPT